MKKYLYITVFFSGMTTLALELSASRLLGSVFGTSNIVWASIIGLILIYLTVGYFIGGRWADLSPYYTTMYKVLAWGAFTSAFVPIVARPVLRFASTAFDVLNIGVLLGSFLVVLILFSVPVTLLGTISPFAIRLAIENRENAGEISGRIYAISTLGSFVGAFLPVLVFIPLLGTTMTFILFGTFLLLIALIGLGISAGWKRVLIYGWMPLVVLIAAWMIHDKPIKHSEGQIFETESGYNYIQVLEEDGYRKLRLNEGQGVHSVWHPDVIDYHGPWEEFLVAPFYNKPTYYVKDVKSIAIVGLAAGTFAKQASVVFGPIPIDGFEIDPEIIRVGQEYFDMNEPNLNPIAQDGRIGLARSRKKYSLIVIDAYRPPYIPWHLTTQEFFQIVHNHLTDDGVIAVNVGRSPDDRRLVDDLSSTIHSVFPSVYVMDLPDTFNSVVYASVQETDIKNLYQNLLDLYAQPDVSPLLLRAIERAVVFQQPVKESGVVFIDDWAPIEWITNNMVISYLMFNDLDMLR